MAETRLDAYLLDLAGTVFRDDRLVLGAFVILATFHSVGTM